MRLRRLWRRVAYCTRDEHRETVDYAGGCALRWLCIDCDRTRWIGWIVRVTNKPRPRRHSWEQPDT